MRINTTWTAVLTLATLLTGCAVEDGMTGDDAELDEIESGGNLLYNGEIGRSSGTDHPLSGWYDYWGTNGRVTAIEVDDGLGNDWGEWDVRIKDDPAFRTRLCQDVDVWHGVPYVFSGWARKRVAGTYPQSLFVEYYDANWKRINASTSSATSATTWTRVKIRFVPPTGARHTLVCAGDGWLNHNSGTYDWDNFVLVEV